MRMDAIVVAAAVAGGSLTLAPPAPAATGGSPAPARGGGVAYGASIPRPDPNPVVRRISITPRALVAGQGLPRVRFRVHQRGVTRVRARVVVARVAGDRPVARVVLGWIRPGRLVTVRWRSRVRLRSGRYVVRVHAVDGRGRTLARSARAPGRARIVVRAPRKAPPPARRPAPAPVPAVGLPAPLSPSPAPSPGGRGIFPVAGEFTFGGADARFGAPRTRHVHQGQDITAATGTPVVAPYAGVVGSTDYQAAGAGEYVVLDAVDGRDYFFAHCVRGSTAVARGASVAAGQRLCQVGSTGASSGSHLHFEIWTVGWRVPGGAPIDPLPELRAWCGC
jgi:hypothetical protein